MPLFAQLPECTECVDSRAEPAEPLCFPCVPRVLRDLKRAGTSCHNENLCGSLGSENSSSFESRLLSFVGSSELVL